MKFFNKLARNEDGATAIEYGLIAALIAVAAITAMSTLGDNLSGTFNRVATEMGNGGGSTGGGSTGGGTTGGSTAPSGT